MHSYAQSRALSATALFHVAAVLRSAAHRVRATARRLDAWIARRRAETPALRELQAMSYRELRDIGLTRSDVQHLAWGGEAPGRPWQESAEAKGEAECDWCGVEADGAWKVAGLDHLDVRLLKDIGAPHWLVARAEQRHGNEHLRWIGLEHC